MTGKKKLYFSLCSYGGSKGWRFVKSVPCGFEIGGNGWDWFKWLCIRVGKIETRVWPRKRNGV